jgi:hypothetical protein
MSMTSAALLTVVVLVAGQFVLFGLSLVAYPRWRVPSRRWNSCSERPR